MTDPRERERREHFEQKYAGPKSAGARDVERAVLGGEVGLDGYTTIEQAQVLGSHLALASHARLLDIGAGRGWPGSSIAAASMCRLVASDRPINALKDAQHYFTRAGIQSKAAAVSADGLALPFRSHSFDAVGHADVFC